jgi:formylglycine-generating enzyme required for sulfatase activity
VTVSDGSLSASDTFLLTVNSAFAIIPQGSFTMGDSVDGMSEALPTRTVTLDVFSIGKYEVTKAEWDRVRTWARNNGYTDLAAGSGKASNHPVHSISWYDILKWCNARSQMEGLTPVYYSNNAQTTIYKTGNVDVTNAQVKWSANGYRLPTEAEWEKAAGGKRFPWGGTISHDQANYLASTSYAYDLSGSVKNYHPAYVTGSQPYTSPVGAFEANSYGLYDIAGNVQEWCWDWYGPYLAAGGQTNPRGNTSGIGRVCRGGSWKFSANISRVAFRNYSVPEGTFNASETGFRVVIIPLVPTISDIAAQSITAGSNTGAIAFTVGDAQTAASSLTLSGSSSNTTLVPNANIVFGGSGSNRTVTVTPVSGQSGTATITVTVSDGSLSASDTFLLTVNENTAPTISDIAAQTIDEGGNTGAIAITVGDAQTAASSLTLSGSSSNTTLVSNANIVFGGSGANRTVSVTPVSGQSGTATITVTVSDGSLSASDTFVLTVNSAMALIPQGAFTMGDSLDGMSDASTRTVTLDAFYLGKYEVTKAQWDEVRTWGLSNGYTDLPAGNSKASDHPVYSITWYDALKWCNARSQKEGLTPVYYTNDAQTTFYKTGSVNVTNAQVKWSANGYRLPTEAEWEKAARGGLSGKRFPWGDTISHSQANYYSSASYSYDVSPTRGEHPTYATSSPCTSSVGAFAANNYNLYDMVGNLHEWCWDWYGTYASGSQINPRGSSSGAVRIYRGGSWSSDSAVVVRVGMRGSVYPQNKQTNLGFRVLRSLAP